ncbi:DUF4129 domain-containing protein [Streptomyces sp. SID486]|uniref:DUF4129 domain-containing protein n=1 Tax=Streptomyces sp. SID486 TaxID=2690264 RepID=UPI0031F6F0B5
MERAVAGGLPPGAATALTALFREARYSTHPMDGNHRDRAAAALAEIADGLRRLSRRANTFRHYDEDDVRRGQGCLRCPYEGGAQRRGRPPTALRQLSANRAPQAGKDGLESSTTCHLQFNAPSPAS